jgi:predicted helicase
MDRLEISEVLYETFLRRPNNLFDSFIDECHKFYEKPAHNLVEIRARENTKIKGDIFEEFCVLYLKYVLNYKNVWLLKDTPDDILEKLGMIRKDMGIDIIVENDGIFQAIQCKYKKHTGYKKNILT